MYKFKGPQPHFKREGFAGLSMLSVLQHVIYKLMAGEGREGKANMEETDGERLP